MGLGTGFTVVRIDVNGNIDRLTKRFLWLKRAMHLVVEILRILHQDKSASVYDAANAAYEKVLKPYHGWITSSVFWGAFKLVPSRETLYENLGKTESLEDDMGSFVAQFGSILSKINDHLESRGLNFPDKV